MVTTSMDPHHHSSEHTTPSEKTPGGTVSRNTEESTDGGSTSSAEHVSKKMMLSETLVEVRQRLHDHVTSPLTQTEQTTKLRRSYILNLCVLSTGFFFLFAAFFALRDSLSSLRHHRNLGLVSLACIYGGYVLGGVGFIGGLGDKKLRPKYTLLLAAAVGLLGFTVANFWPRFETLVPASLVLGVSLAPLWTAQGTYLTSLGLGYGAVMNRGGTAGTGAGTTSPDRTLGLFNGVFLLVLQISHVVGNLIASGVFSIGIQNSGPELTNLNSSIPTSILDSHFSPDYDTNSSYYPSNPWKEPTENLAPLFHEAESPDGSNMGFVSRQDPDEQDLYLDPEECVWSNRMSWMVATGIEERNPTLNFIFVGILCAMNVIGLLILLLFLGKLDVILCRPGLQGKGLLGLHRQPRVLLLLPTMLYLGIEQGFIYGEITHVFVSCGVGVHMVGFAMVFFCASSALTSFLVGLIQAACGRRLILLAGGALNLGLLTLLFLWRGEAGLGTVFGVLLALGAVDGVWQTQACTVCGIVLGLESGFACLRLYEALGLCLSFTLSIFLSTHTILWVNAGLLVLALSTYTVAESLVKKERKEKGEKETSKEERESEHFEEE